MTEIWKDTIVFGGIYQVSSLGNVRSKDRYVNASHNSTRLVKGRLLNPYNHSHGYKVVCLSNNMDKKYMFVHRLVAFAFHDTVEGKLYCNHIDGNKANNVYTNIEWCNHSENGIHAHNLGLNKARDHKGQNSPRTKLNNNDIIEIRERCANGERPAHIAHEYGLKRAALSNIVSRRSWAHI